MNEKDLIEILKSFEFEEDEKNKGSYIFNAKL